MRLFSLMFTAACTLLLTACPSSSPDETAASPSGNPKVLRVGFIPSENMEEIQKNAQPLVDMMSKKIGLEIQPFVATDYTGVVEAFRANKLDAAFLTPASYVMANSEAGVKVILKAQRGENPFYYSIVFTHKDSGVNTLSDFKGKTFAFGDTLSTAGYIYPLTLFHKQGINPNSDFDNVIFSGGHDATVLAVLNKKVTGGATYANDPQGKDAAWKHLLKPEEASQLKVIAVSEPIPADNISISKDLSPETAEKVQRFFLDISKDPAGQALIQKLYRIDAFVPATDDDYKGIRAAFSTSGIELRKELGAPKG
jgi:phosphonate transport system substrate-binding protein